MNSNTNFTSPQFPESPKTSKNFLWSILLVTVVVAGYFLYNKISELDISPKDLTASAYDSVGQKNIAKLNKDLLEAIDGYGNTVDPEDSSKSVVALAQVAKVAKDRNEALISLMQKNPGLARANLLPYGLIKKFPEEIQNLLEQQVEVIGEINAIHIDYTDERKSFTVYEFNADSSIGQDNVYFTADDPSVMSGSKVKIKGTKVGNNVLVDTSDTSNFTVTQAAAAGPTGDQKTLVMMINFTNSTSQPWTQSQVADTVFYGNRSTNTYYKEVSYNQTSFSGDVTPWMTIPYTNANCSTMYNTWGSAADTEATKLGYNLSNYTRKLYVMGGTTGCGWGGLSYVGGTPSRSWVVTNDLNTINHEIGHALGVWHSSSISCGTKSIDVYSNCTGSEYGDNFDTMGYLNSFHMSGVHKNQLGFLPSTRMQTITAAGTYKVAPVETLTSATQLLRVAKANTGNYYYIDYRQPVGYDSSLPAAIVNGVSLKIAPGMFSGVANSANTLRIDPTPTDGFGNSALADGMAFVDYINGITIKQVSHDATGATIEVSMSAPTCVSAQPKINGITPSSQQGTAGQKLNYSISVTNQDNSACSASTFNVNATVLPSGFTSTSGSASIAPGSTVSIPFAVTSPTTASNGTYTFTATAEDSTNASRSGSAPAGYVVFSDITAPIVNLTSPADGAKLARNQSVKVSATDNVKVTSIQVYVDGALLTSSTASTLSYKWNTGSVVSGPHTLLVKVSDGAGNIGQKTITVYK